MVAEKLNRPHQGGPALFRTLQHPTTKSGAGARLTHVSSTASLSLPRLNRCNVRGRTIAGRQCARPNHDHVDAYRGKVEYISAPPPPSPGPRLGHCCVGSRAQGAWADDTRLARLAATTPEIPEQPVLERVATRTCTPPRSLYIHLRHCVRPAGGERKHKLSGYRSVCSSAQYGCVPNSHPRPA